MLEKLIEFFDDVYDGVIPDGEIIELVHKLAEEVAVTKEF